jgi:hypothetical protein
MVITAYMEHLVASPPVAMMPDAIGAMPRGIEVGQLLGVKVEQVAGSCVLIAVVRLFLLERSGSGDPRPPEPEPDRATRDSKVPGDPDRRLAQPSSTYGLDDKAKLVASTKAVRLAGSVLKPMPALLPEATQPLMTRTLTESGHGGCLKDRHPCQDPLNEKCSTCRA